MASSPPLRVCVFGSSSSRTREAYTDAAAALGRLIAAKGYVCLTGGGRFGCMGAVNNGVREGGGRGD